MGRHSIYIKPDAEERIKKKAESARADGAIGSEASISGIGGRLLELGLRVEDARNNTAAKGPNYKQRLIEETVRSRYLLEAMFLTLLKLPEIKRELPISPEDFLRGVKAKADKEIMEFLDEED